MASDKVEAQMLDKDYGMKFAIGQLRQVSKMAVKAGVNPPESTRRHGKKKGVNVATVAMAHEFGAPGTPSRSFLRAPFDKALGAVSKRVHGLMRNVISRKPVNAGIELGRIGAFLVTQFLDAIDRKIPPPLSPMSVRRKQITAPRHALTPLRETDQMYNAIGHRVLKRGKGV